jgi:thioredoxin 2
MSASPRPHFAAAGRHAVFPLVACLLACLLCACVLGACVLGACVLGGCGAASGPKPPFTSQPYAEAASTAQLQGRLLLVDATATWCGPCQTMERETWPDARVGAWLAEHAVAVQVDVDAERDVAQALGIEAMPTLILMRDGRELARSVGALDADELLAWLEGVAKQG